MIMVRRWYIFLVSAISLQAVTWAIIVLVRNLMTLGFTAPVEATAFQIAVVIIGLPVFLVHWLWAQRLARQTADERQSALRRLYLYGMLAGFLGPFAANAYTLVVTLLRMLLGEPDPGPNFFTSLSPGDTILHALVALVILGLLWAYHWWIIAEDAQSVPETGNAALVRRLYILAFSAVGVIMTTIALIELVRWLMYQFGEAAIGASTTSILTGATARLVIGIPLWVIFWRWAQRLFAGPGVEERTSVLRKVYLYLIVLVTVLGFVSLATTILAGFLRRLLDLPSTGDIRDPLSIMLVMAVMWVYHAIVLRDDAALAGRAPRQAGVRRIYLYLVAAVGLAALLIGVSGDISVLIRALAGATFGSALREQVAWFTAAIIAGLPVWLLPFRKAELVAEASGVEGEAERRSIVRKIYLYFYLFVGTMTVLGGAVYIVFQLLSLILGGRSSTNLLSDLGQAIAFSLIAVGVLIYHGLAVRGDGKLNEQEQATRLADWRIAVVDAGEGKFGRATLDQLQEEIPGLTLDPIGLTEQAAGAMGMQIPQTAISMHLAEAKLIIGPWDIAVVNGAGGAVTAEIAQAVMNSPARKLLAPVHIDGWEWAGVERRDTEAIVHQTVHAVKQMAAGEEVEPASSLGWGAIVGIVIGGLFLLWLLAIPIVFLFSSF